MGDDLDHTDQVERARGAVVLEGSALHFDSISCPSHFGHAGIRFHAEPLPPLVLIPFQNEACRRTYVQHPAGLGNILAKELGISAATVAKQAAFLQIVGVAGGSTGEILIAIGLICVVGPRRLDWRSLMAAGRAPADGVTMDLEDDSQTLVTKRA